MSHPPEYLSPYSSTISTRFGWIPSPRSACPPVETIRQAVDHDLGVQETRALVDHLSGCADCFAAWRRARARQRENARSLLQTAS